MPGLSCFVGAGSGYCQTWTRLAKGRPFSPPMKPLSSSSVFRLAVIGDLHTHWDAVDVRQFAASGYDLHYFVGDLGGGTPKSTTRIARSISQLQQPALVMPGNNDTWDINELAAELAHQNGLNRLLSITSATEDSYSPIELCGYSRHHIRAGARAIDLIAARPHSLGGPTLSFPDFMADTYQVQSLEDSAARLCQLIDAAEAEELIFLSHNGPLGLGAEPDAMWGCDFKDNGGDWGDPDLAIAIDHARATGKRVLAVIAGHMHLRTKQGAHRLRVLSTSTRRWCHVSSPGTMRSIAIMSLSLSTKSRSTRKSCCRMRAAERLVRIPVVAESRRVGDWRCHTIPRWNRSGWIRCWQLSHRRRPRRRPG
jgi:uncharacterized protein (TIGR04168 family)